MAPEGIMLFGWAKPVPVNPSNLSNRKRDDILISMAGPAMNLILAVGVLVIYRVAIEMPGGIAGSAFVAQLETIAYISMILCLFNLMPIPPLDGSHVMRHMVGMSEETYRNIAQFGFIILIVVINIPGVISFIVNLNLQIIGILKKLLLFSA